MRRRGSLALYPQNRSETTPSQETIESNKPGRQGLYLTLKCPVLHVLQSRTSKLRPDTLVFLCPWHVERHQKLCNIPENLTIIDNHKVRGPIYRKKCCLWKYSGQESNPRDFLLHPVSFGSEQSFWRPSYRPVHHRHLQSTSGTLHWLQAQTSTHP